MKGLHIYASRMENITLSYLQNEYSLPPSLLERLKGSNFYVNSIGCSDTKVIFIENQEEDSNLYLKIMPVDHDERLEDEKNILCWAREYIPVPAVVDYGKDRNYQYLLMTELKGVCSFILEENDKIEKRVGLLANSLRLIHGISTSNCPFDNRLDVKLKKAHFRVKNNLVDPTDFEDKNQGKTPSEVFEICMKNKPGDEDIVFTHGDYCLPNIIVNHNDLSGFIDFGRAGLADKYQDLALGYRSIFHNFKDKRYSKLFLEMYDLRNIDYQKLEYYITLDDLF